MIISKENQISLVILTSILFIGIGPGKTNYPFSAIFILIFIFIDFLKNRNLKFKIEKIFFVPLILLLLTYILGPLLNINIINFTYYIDRLIMCFVFFIYGIYLNRISLKLLISSSIKSCLIIFPFYILESILIITNQGLLKNIRSFLGLRTIYVKNLLTPILGNHEPSQMVITTLFILFTVLVLKNYFRLENNLSKTKNLILNILFLLSLFYFSGSYFSTILVSLLAIFFTLLIRFLKTKKLLIINSLKINYIIFLFILTISLLLSGIGYLSNKIQIVQTGDISTITRSYQIFRAVSDLKMTNGLGTGPGTYETVTKESNMAILNDYSFLKNYSYYTNGLLEKEYLKNKKIPFYSIVGKITSELGILGFALISFPFLYTIYLYFREIIFNKFITFDLIQIYFFSIGSYLVMIAGGLRGSIIQWLILIISLKLLDYKKKLLLKYKE